MPTNATTFNSRVTSEALEAKFRQVFPAQAGAELIQDLYASGVIQPVIDFSTVAEGSVLPENLQTAWDFATGYSRCTNVGVTTLISTPGFWKVDLTATFRQDAGVSDVGNIYLDDSTSTKTVWYCESGSTSGTDLYEFVTDNSFVVFLRSGDTLKCQTNANTAFVNVWYRQIADVNGNLVNPLGFTFS